MENINSYEEVKEYISEPGNKEILEERVKIWTKKINDVCISHICLNQLIYIYLCFVCLYLFMFP